MENEFWDTWHWVSVVAYPVVAWLAYRGGKVDGMVATIEALHNQGLIQLEDEEETQHGNN